MVSTTFAAAVLTAALSTGAVATPSWQSDYATALTAAAAQKKPVAVFIGQGDAGYAQLIGGRELPAAAGEVLAKNYVCVYVDTATAEGKALAGKFELNTGVVISNSGGTVQALRHAGAVSPAALTGYVTQYSQPTSAVVRTETAGAVVPAGVVMGGCANGRCGLSTGYYQPAPAYPSYPAFSSCPNGRCPNAR